MDIPGLDELAASNPAAATRLRAMVGRLRSRAESWDWATARLGRFVAATGHGAALAALVDEVRSLTGAEDVWAGLWSGRIDDGTLSFQALASVGEDVPDPRAISRTIVAEASASGLPVWTDQAAADPRFGGAPSVVATGSRSVGCIPIGDAGVLYLRDGTRPFDPAAQARVESLAALAAAFLVQEGEGEGAGAARPRAGSFEPIPGLVGESRPMAELAAAIRSFARMPWPALVLGETGTGKETVARALHALAPRAGEPFIAVNCGAIPDELAESVLFGHERGAFTGADRRKEGLVERTGRGTLFLDEVGEAPARLQVKLLRLLQEGVFERVGGQEELRFRGRIVAATWRALGGADSAFRADLFHRLSAGVLRVPPLRDRRGDIPSLALWLLERAQRELPNAEGIGVSDAALRELAAREWPGNVRELDNAVKGAVAWALSWGDRTIGPEHLVEVSTGSAGTPGVAPQGLLAATEAFQREMVRTALEATGQNRSAAAERLGVTRQWLHRLLARWGGQT